MPKVEPYVPQRGLVSKLQRRVVQWRYAAPMNIRPPRPIMSLTFDDCPKSAISVGGPILDEYNVRACFYVASKLMESDTVMGRIAGKDDLKAVFRTGHEIGAHTHSHIDCAQTPICEVLADIDQNLDALDEITGGAEIKSFAYPFGETSFALKKRLADKFTSLRGVLAGNNRGLVDRAHLRSFEIDGSQFSVDRILAAMEASAHMPSWTILFTHDVSDAPSGYGITPHQLRTVLDRAKALNVEIDTPAHFVQQIGGAVA